MKTRIIQNDPDGRAYGPVPDPTHDISGPTGPAPAESGLRGFVRRHQLVIFFVLTFAMGWCLLPIGTFNAFAPLISVLLVVGVAEGRSGLLRIGRRMILWRVRGIFYVAAIVLPLLVHALAIGLNMAAGAPAPSFAQFQPWYAVLLVFGLRMVNPTDGPLGEEPAWRGYAQPRLQRGLSPLAATGVLGLVITAWHLPLVFMPQFDLGFPDIASTVVVTFWYAWLFNRTGGSVLLTLIAHVTEGSINTGGLWPAGPDADRLAWTWLIAWTVLALSLIVFDRRAWRRPVPTD